MILTSNIVSMNRTILVLSILLSITACKDKPNSQNIPEVFVDISLSLSLPAYSPLIIPGNSIYITGGSNGIVVYALSNEEYIAIDRHCSYDIDGFHRVVVDPLNNTTLVDSVNCTSVFSIFNGDVIQGPSSIPLKRYNTEYFSGSNVLRIYN